MPLPATVELINSLPNVVLAGNRVPLKFLASANYLENAGTKAKIVLPWTAAAVADEYFDIVMFGQTVRFTCKAAPDNSGLQFHDNVLAAELNDWVALVAADMRKNYLISRYYNLTVVTSSITIEAKETGPAYSLDFTGGSGIDVVADETNKTGIDRKIREFYYVVVLLWVGTEFVQEILLNIDDAGLAEFDVSVFLKPYVSQDFKWPESNADFIFSRESALLPWHFKYGERWGAGDYRAMIDSATYHVMHGGVSWMQNAKYNSDNSSYWAKLQYNKYFLSWAPLSKVIGPAEPVKLYFVNHTAATTLKLKAKLYTASSNSTITIDTVAGVADKAMYEMILSPAKVNYAGLANETLLKLEAWIDNEVDVRVSEIRTFVIDYADHEHTRFFIFRNSLGAYEVLRSTGLMTKGDEYSREMATIAVDTDYTSKDREELSVTNIEQQKFTVALGWLSRYGNPEEYRNWLRDFALSREVYQAIGNTLKPIRLTSSNMEHGKDRDTLSGFVFEFVNAFTDEHFTKEITWNLLDESFSSDFEKAQ